MGCSRFQGAPDRVHAGNSGAEITSDVLLGHLAEGRLAIRLFSNPLHGPDRTLDVTKEARTVGDAVDMIGGDRAVYECANLLDGEVTEQELEGGDTRVIGIDHWLPCGVT